MQRRPTVVIVGAGFAGIQTATSLTGAAVDVVLIDQHSYQTFIPLLFQVAASVIAPESVTCSIQSLVRRSPNTRFLHAQVTGIHPNEKWVATSEGAIAYDFLVIATGSRARFLGVPGAEQHGFTLRTLDQALRLRHHVSACLDSALSEPDDHVRQQLLTIAIVGGGATGVEMAGALQSWFHRTIRRDYPDLATRQFLDTHPLTITVLQSGDRLLPSLPESLSRYAEKRLRNQGTTIHCNTVVERVRSNGVDLTNGTNIDASTVIWAVGVEAAVPVPSPHTPSPLAEHDISAHHCPSPPAFAQARGGRLVVDRALRVIGAQDNDVDTCVFAVGDVAYVEQGERPLAGLATEAMQQGRHVARMIRRSLQSQEPRAFHYFDKGKLAIIHPGSAVCQIGWMQLRGWLAWMIWLAVHLMVLPGWKNRGHVLLRWMRVYGLGDRPPTPPGFTRKGAPHRQSYPHSDPKALLDRALGDS